jgi:hypothetical protein
VCFVLIVQIIRVIFKYGITLLLRILNIQFIPQLERAGGGAIGLGRGVIVCGIVLLCLSFLPSDYISQSIFEKSFSGKFLVKATERTYKALTFWIPPEEAGRAIFDIPSAVKKAKKI